MWFKNLFTYMSRILRRIFIWIFKPFDKVDFILALGLIMLGGGIYTQVPWLAFCVIGSIIIIIGIAGAIKP